MAMGRREISLKTAKALGLTSLCCSEQTRSSGDLGADIKTAKGPCA